MTPAIEIKNLSKVFRISTSFGKKSKFQTVFDKLNLDVQPGEVVALLGPNGAGKTTLIKILCTLILPDEGEAKITGFDLVREADKVKRVISLAIADERSFYWRLTGRENLEFFATLYGVRGRQASQKITAAANSLDIDFLDQRYQEYSAGMKQRLALARSFLNDASVIFMDEPTRSLDSASALHLKKTIKQFSREQGRTVLFAMHQLGEIEDLVDKVVRLKKEADEPPH